jgi:hypothetical protein
MDLLNVLNRAVVAFLLIDKLGQELLYIYVEYHLQIFEVASIMIRIQDGNKWTEEGEIHKQLQSYGE